MNKSHNIKAICAGNCIAVIWKGAPTTITSEHPNFKKLKELISRKRFSEKHAHLLSIKESVKKFTGGAIKLEGDKATWNEQEVHTSFVDRVIDMKSKDLNPASVKRFLALLDQNLEPHVKKDLFDFLKHRNTPLTPKGRFLAYKYVDQNFMDCYSHSFDNTPGKDVEVARREVNPNRDECSSYGLHAGSLDYVTNNKGSGRVVVVEINPKDVVAVPTDYNAQKLRVCCYRVLREHLDEAPPSEPVFTEKRPKAASTLTKQQRASKMSTKQCLRFIATRLVLIPHRFLNPKQFNRKELVKFVVDLLQ